MFKHPFYSMSGVVASEHPLASLIGSKVLEKGNSVDAAIATSLVLAVTLPHLGGIGGDFFALVRDPNGKVYFVDGSGYAPSKLTRKLLLSLGYKSMPVHGPLSINVPGMIDGLRIMWENWGTIEWRELVDYASRIAGKGFIVTRSLALSLRNLYDDLSADPGSRETYYRNGIPREGEAISFKGLAQALKLIGDDPRNFYEGEIAERIVDYVKSRGGVLELSDLKRYRASLGEPINIEYKGRLVYEMPPSTQGITSLHLLKLLEEYDLKSMGLNSSERVKLFLKAAQIAYRVRDSYITDPRYMKLSVEYLLSNKFIEMLRDEMRRNTRKNNGIIRKLDGDTTFFAIADKDGWIVAGIQSLFYPFGSYITEPEFNITLNSRASSFSLSEDHVNRLEPLKKTMHTLSAIMVEDNGRVLAIGLSGGHFRPLLHAQILTNIIDYGLGIQEAIEYPRFIWYLWTNNVDYEEGLDVSGLEGYVLKKKAYPSRLGVASIVEVREGVRAGYTDIRGDGIPIGLP